MTLTSPPSWLLPALALAVGVGIPTWAAHARGRTYGIFAAVVLAFSFPAGVALGMRLQSLLGPLAGPAVGWLFAYALAVTGVHFASLVRARLRTRAFRWAVSVPAQAFIALGAFSLPFLLALAPVRIGLWAVDAAGPLRALHWLDLIPIAVIGFSVATSLRPRREIVRVTLGGPEPDSLTRLPVERRAWGEEHHSPARPLRIVQITDPHLGPWAPIHRLRRRIDELLDHEPDLVLLTGDFLTMEGNGTPGALSEALAPVRRAEGRSFAIFGNHARFCASLPNAKIGYITSAPCTDANDRTPLSPRSSSCMINPYETLLSPAQPYSSGRLAPKTPSSATSGISSFGKRPCT